ncbi:S8 family peptidase [Herpetosiphon llansteffanensis]
MDREHRRGLLQGRLVLALILVVSLLGIAQPAPATQQVLVQGGSLSQQTGAIQAVGGTIQRQFSRFETSVAHVSTTQIEQLQAQGLRVFADQTVEASAQTTVEQTQVVMAGPKGKTPPALQYPSIVTGADALQRRGIDGRGVTVAVIDSGLPGIERPERWQRINNTTARYNQGSRFLVYKDMLASSQITNSSDPYGHGTHVFATLADNRALPAGYGTAKVGIAPGANYVVVRALDSQGKASYSTIIAAIDWVIENADQYNIRVLNLSLQAEVVSPYWYDPMNQAVMHAWNEGITVVAAAGNTGSNPATIMAPANVPYIVSVGAIRPAIYNDNSSDTIAAYSSAGPTESRFVKPDVVIAGSRVIAPLPADSVLANSGAAGLVSERAQLQWADIKTSHQLNYYALSGTSMAAAEVSGIVALLLQDEPTLTNNQIKARLTGTAQIATLDNGQAAYSMWQQGAGKVIPTAVVDGSNTGSANAGMDLTTDLIVSSNPDDSTNHYQGTTEYDSTSNTFSDSTTAYSSTLATSYSTWAGSYSTWAGSYLTWAGSYSTWAGSYSTWAGSYSTWAGSYSTWAGSYSTWAGSYSTWAGNNADAGSINTNINAGSLVSD